MPLTLLAILFGAVFTVGAAYSLGALLLRKLAAPPEIALGVGAAGQSLIVFFLLLAGVARWPVFLAAGILPAIARIWFRRPPLPEPAKSPLRRGWIIAGAVFGAYGIWYFVNALAPETLADGITYHLGLPYEYVRLGGFPHRITFYDVIPQGMEMLYTMAFAFGRHSAAKLVEFAFFIATVPLIFRIGRRLQMTDLANVAAAAIYFCAPVCGLTGASSYNDAAGVFFTLAAFYLLLVWRDSGDVRYLLPAGTLAGFCYAIKVPGIFTVIAALLFVLAASAAGRSNRRRAAIFLLTGATLTVSPWLLRNLILTRNPVAPLMNGLFPNPYFAAATERDLSAGLRSLGPVRRFAVPWELAFGDRLTGTFGPLLLALPIGLLSLRRGAGRLAWAAALLLTLPWFSNVGARFLMPAVICAAFALAMILPKPAAWAAIAVQAVLCWPQVMDLRETRYRFRLHDFPLAAALRIEPESAYLKPRVQEFNVAKMIEAKTPPDAKILSLLPVANAYLARDVRVSWQSEESERLVDTLHWAAPFTGEPLFEWTAAWPLQTLRAVRFRLPVADGSEFHLNEVRVFYDTDLVYASPNWRLRAWPNRWEAPLAVDDNFATRWRFREPVRPGMYLEMRFDRPQRISSAVLSSYTSSIDVPIEFYGEGADGHWRFFGIWRPVRRPRGDLRIEASLALRRAGYRYILAETGFGGNAPIGNALLGQEPEWSLERVGEAGRYYLFRVK